MRQRRLPLPTAGTSDASAPNPSPLKLASLLGTSPPPARPTAPELPLGLAPAQLELAPPPPLHIDPFAAFPSALWPQPCGLASQDYGYGFPAPPGSPWASQLWGADPYTPPLMPPPCPLQEWESGLAVLDQVGHNLSGLRSKMEGALEAPIAVSLEQELAAEAARDEPQKKPRLHRI